jgi:hypothetical protein
MLDVLKILLNLFLQRRLEIEFVDGIEWHNWMQQMVGVQALGTDLLLTLKAEEDEVLLM